MNYLEFNEIGTSPSGKTKRIEVRNSQSKIQLGWISWFSSWRKYCLSAAPATVWDSNCLNEIINYLDKLNEDHKK